jgi:hypothetical protein
MDNVQQDFEAWMGKQAFRQGSRPLIRDVAWSIRAHPSANRMYQRVDTEAAWLTWQYQSKRIAELEAALAARDRECRALVEMLTDEWEFNNPGVSMPDFVTMAIARQEAKTGKTETIAALLAAKAAEKGVGDVN